LLGNESVWTSIPIPTDHVSAFEQWVEHIQRGTTATENIQMALDLTRLMEAANHSAKNQIVVRLDDLAQ
jgi:hypothetical protein